MKILNFDVMRRMKTVKRIVLHHSESNFGNAAIFHGWHKDAGFAGLAYHYVIGNGNGLGAGEIEVGRMEMYRGAHAKGGNKDSVGIVLVGSYMNKVPLPEQLKALTNLVTQICFRYNLDPDGSYGKGKGMSKVVCGHRDVKGSKTNCPGDAFYSLLPSIRSSVKLQLKNYVDKVGIVKN